MFTLVVDEKLQRQARGSLEQNFKVNAEIIPVRLSSRRGGGGGPLPIVNALYRADLDIWGYFGEEDNAKYFTAFGIGMPERDIGIEINIPLGRNLRIAGQIVTNEYGRLFIAHRGGLGGGTFPVSKDDFAALLGNFNRSEVEHYDKTLNMYVLADVDQIDELPKLALYIREAEKIRDIRRKYSPSQFKKLVLEQIDRKKRIIEDKFSRISTRNQGSMNIEFTLLIKDLFEREGLKVKIEARDRETRTNPDMILISKSGLTAVVEIKLFRSGTIGVREILPAAYQLESIRRRWEGARLGIIILPNKLSPGSAKSIRNQFPRLLVYDLSIVLGFIIKHPDLRPRLDSITQEAFPFSDELDIQPADRNVNEDISAPTPAAVDFEPPPPIQRGDTLCKEIHAVEHGKPGAKAFENKCVEILKYLFEDHLTGWREQEPTDSKISIFDLITRVRSANDFWRIVRDEFKSHYVIFEFKNYEDKITQKEIYTTEKYLFRTALRSTAIILSRQGADENALAASRGALREVGKLIININLGDLCKMLAMKDRGDEPTDYLVEYLDKMLMKLER